MALTQIQHRHRVKADRVARAARAVAQVNVKGLEEMQRSA